MASDFFHQSGGLAIGSILLVAISEIKVVMNFAINYTARVASSSNLVFKYLALRTIKITFKLNAG
jgi:hypothetical protein